MNRAERLIAAVLVWAGLPILACAGEVALFGLAGGGNGSYAVRVKSLREVRFDKTVSQQRDWSCGSAAVATLLTYHYGHPITEPQAIEAMFASGDQDKIRKEGFSLLDMKRFLESLGYTADGFEASLDKLARVGVPAIVLINDGGYNHFVVVKGIRYGNILVGDPARGARVIPRAAFEAMWPNRILFVITNRRTDAFNSNDDWKYMASPLGTAISRESLGSMMLFRPGANDF